MEENVVTLQESAEIEVGRCYRHPYGHDRFGYVVYTAIGRPYRVRVNDDTEESPDDDGMRVRVFYRSATPAETSQKQGEEERGAAHRRERERKALERQRATNEWMPMTHQLRPGDLSPEQVGSVRWISAHDDGRVLWKIGTIGHSGVLRTEVTGYGMTGTMIAVAPHMARACEKYVELGCATPRY
jgi:hypothetical protein